MKILEYSHWETNRYVPIFFLIPIHPNERHHFPHILPTPSLLSNMMELTNQNIGVYQSCPMQQLLPTVPLVHGHSLWTSEFMLPTSATLPTRSTSPSLTTSSTSRHTQRHSWRNIGCSSSRRNQYTYINVPPPSHAPLPTHIFIYALSNPNTITAAFTQWRWSYIWSKRSYSMLLEWAHAWCHCRPPNISPPSSLPKQDSSIWLLKNVSSFCPMIMFDS